MYYGIPVYCSYVIAHVPVTLLALTYLSFSLESIIFVQR